MPQGVRSRDFGTHSAPPSRDNCRNKQVGVSTHRPQRKLREQTAHTDRRRDNCKTNSITRQRQLQNKQRHDRRENCGTNTSTSAEKTAEQTSHILSASQLEHTARTHVVGTAIRTMQAKNQHLVSIAAQTHGTHMLLAKQSEPCREQRKQNRATGRANRTYSGGIAPRSNTDSNSQRCACRPHSTFTLVSAPQNGTTTRAADTAHSKQFAPHREPCKHTSSTRQSSEQTAHTHTLAAQPATTPGGGQT